MKLQHLITVSRNPKSQLFNIQTLVWYLWHMVRKWGARLSNKVIILPLALAPLGITNPRQWGFFFDSHVYQNIYGENHDSWAS